MIFGAGCYTILYSTLLSTVYNQNIVLLVLCEWPVHISPTLSLTSAIRAYNTLIPKYIWMEREHSTHTVGSERIHTCLNTFHVIMLKSDTENVQISRRLHSDRIWFRWRINWRWSSCVLSIMRYFAIIPVHFSFLLTEEQCGETEH